MAQVNQGSRSEDAHDAHGQGTEKEAACCLLQAQGQHSKRAEHTAEPQQRLSGPVAGAKGAVFMDAGGKDDMSFTMYVPAKAKKLDGTFSLNGNILLNSGREVL